MIKQAQSPRTGPKLVRSDTALDQGPADAATSDSSKVRLKSFVERVERLNEEKAATNNDIKEVYAEAKGTGFDVPAIKIIIRKRAMDQGARAEQEEIIDLYMRALGMTV
jgi:uncharacterized protein (UPF0335 family)